MSRMARGWGIARSLATYHLIPFRQRRLRRLYSPFVARGDLAFDIGAHAGNRTRALAALGCRVVAVEPQPDFATILRMLSRRMAQVTVVEAAAARTSGRLNLRISEATPTVSTMVQDWRDIVARNSRFRHVRWNRTVEVDAITIDHLIGWFGVPALVKIDVEGAEPYVLDGLSRAIPVLSFEYLPGLLESVERSVQRLGTLGTYLFNWSPGESYRLAEEVWLSAADLMKALGTHRRAQRTSGDVYARLAVGRAAGAASQKFAGP